MQKEVIIKLPGTVLVYSVGDFLRFINADPTFFAKGIKGGKWHKRREAAQGAAARESEKYKRKEEEKCSKDSIVFMTEE